MPYTVIYSDKVIKKHIPALPKAARETIKRAIETRLTESPDGHGKPLSQSLKGNWSLRVDDWRVIYRVEGTKVLILTIGHRRDAYDIVRRILGQ